MLISRTDLYSLICWLIRSQWGQKDAFESEGWQKTSRLALTALEAPLCTLLRQSSNFRVSSIVLMPLTRSHSPTSPSTIAKNATTNSRSPSTPLPKGIMHPPANTSSLIHTLTARPSIKTIPTVGRKKPQAAVSATNPLNILSNCSQGFPSWAELRRRKKLRLQRGACRSSHR